ncbi:MAG: helix-turn-helix transcriptional regulator [Spirochaetales bacterium]|nr:helix-turn-helix transcriptional regulator [Spirochaetales bacterium]
MAILMWVLNLFSLFSCFGALVVLIFLVVKSRNALYWKLLAIIVIFVLSYASGMASFILRYGFTIPEVLIEDIIPADPSWMYYAGNLLNLIQAILIISLTGQILSVPVKRTFVFFILFSLPAYFVPDAILLFNPLFVAAKGNLFIVIRLLFGYGLMEYALLTGISRHKVWRKSRSNWLFVMLVLFAFPLVPAMLFEDLMLLFGGMLVYNIIEALGFFLLMSTIMIAGIQGLSSRSGTAGGAVSLLEISREYGLTEREMDVLRELVASSSASYKDIAAKLNISPETVKTHVSRIYRKLGVSAKQELKYKINGIQL